MSQWLRSTLTVIVLAFVAAIVGFGIFYFVTQFLAFLDRIGA